MKLLITGGAGFIGSAVVRLAIAQGHEVVVLDALTYAACLDNLAPVSGSDKYRFVEGDICDRALLDQVLGDHRPEAVMHLAAESHVDRSIDGPGAFIETNITGTYTLLEAARCYWRDSSKSDSFRFHHISTDEVFGSLGKQGILPKKPLMHPTAPMRLQKPPVIIWFGLGMKLTDCRWC